VQAPRPRRARLRVLALLAAVAIGTAGGVVGTQHALAASDPASAPLPRAARLLPPSPFPRLPADARSTRVLPVVPVTVHGPHTFLSTLPDGQPVTFDPCRPIHWVVNPDGMPAGGLPLLRDAFAVVSADTGLEFEEDGDTREPYAAQRAPRQPAYYGTGWAPVLVAWANAQEVPELADDVVGSGGNTVMTPADPGEARIVSGSVVLDKDFFAAALPGQAGRGQARAAVLHELGHVVGLGHVDDRRQLMYARDTGVLTFGPGDREGLALLGAGACHIDT
jgi:hypothetical protein